MAMIGAALAFVIRRTLRRNTALNAIVFMVTMIMIFMNVGVISWDVGIAICRLTVILLGLRLLYPVLKRLKSGPEAAPFAAFSPTRGGK